MDTKVTRGSDGWRAETCFSLTETQALKVTTYKGYRGLVTTAIVVEPTPTGFKWSPLEDYSEQLRDAGKLRCTERAVREEHMAALQSIEAVRERALQHYAKKELA